MWSGSPDLYRPAVPIVLHRDARLHLREGPPIVTSFGSYSTADAHLHSTQPGFYNILTKRMTKETLERRLG